MNRDYVASVAQTAAFAVCGSSLGSRFRNRGQAPVIENYRRCKVRTADPKYGGATFAWLAALLFGFAGYDFQKLSGRDNSGLAPGGGEVFSIAGQTRIMRRGAGGLRAWIFALPQSPRRSHRWKAGPIRFPWRMPTICEAIRAPGPAPKPAGAYCSSVIPCAVALAFRAATSSSGGSSF